MVTESPTLLAARGVDPTDNRTPNRKASVADPQSTGAADRADTAEVHEWSLADLRREVAAGVGRIEGLVGTDRTSELLTQALERARSRVEERNRDLWATGREPMAFDRFCRTIDPKAPLTKRQLQVFRRAGLLRARNLVDPHDDRKQEIVLAWGKGCLGAETLLTDLSTGETQPVAVWAAMNRPIRLRTLDRRGRVIETWTDGPVFRKGTAQLFRITLENGRSFRATAAHRCQTPTGWQRLSKFKAGETLLRSQLPDVRQPLSRYSRVMRIDAEGVEDYYDLTIPETECYFDDQETLHHNSGKDFLSARFIAWVAYVVLSLRGDPATRLTELGANLGPYSTLSAINVAPNQRHARTVFFDYLRRNISHPLFRQWRRTINSDEIIFWGKDEYGEDYKPLCLRSLASSTSGLDGFNILCFVMDELDAFLDTDKRSNAEDLHHILISSAGTRMRKMWVGMAIGYTRMAGGAMERLLEHAQKHPRLFASDRAASWDVRPGMVSRDDPGVAFEYDTNPTKAMCEYECNPSASEGAFFSMPSRIEDALDDTLSPLAVVEYDVKERVVRSGQVQQFRSVSLSAIKPRPGFKYFLGGDGGENSDSFALAVVSVDLGADALPWICPRCGGDRKAGGDPAIGRELRAGARYRRCGSSESEPSALCGVCGVSPVKWNRTQSVAGWWRSPEPPAPLIIESPGGPVRLPHVTEELLIEVRPRKATRKGDQDQPVDFLAVQEVCCQLATVLPLSMARFDPWATPSIRQAMVETGCDADKILFSNMLQYTRACLTKTCLHIGGISLLPDTTDICRKRTREWKQLQSDGKKIDHPEHGSKDLYDAESVAIWCAITSMCANWQVLV